MGKNMRRRRSKHADDLDEELRVYAAGRVHLHFLHLVRIELFLYALRQRGGQTTPRRRLASPIVDRGGESVIYGQVGREGEPLRGSRRRTLGKRGRVRREHRR